MIIQGLLLLLNLSFLFSHHWDNLCCFIYDVSLSDSKVLLSASHWGKAI